MKRLVYSPSIQAFIKSDDGVVDVSPYIVSGSINRRINQLSSAELILRNPVIGGSANLLFTENTGKNGSDDPHPLFHPMDPIIISMTRIQGHPVQVFTGYLDKSPYIQLYPGLCRIEASCTLKRLQYTQWDAALPWVTYFLAQFGWAPNPDTGLVNPSAEQQRLKVQAGKIQGQFNDGSIGALLFAVLTYIGQWDASTIWIEQLPKEIVDLVVSLYNAIEGEVKTGEDQFQTLLTQILGTTSQGSGSASGGGGNPATSVTGAIKSAAGLTVKGGAMNSTQLGYANQIIGIGEQQGASSLAIEAVIFDAIFESDLGTNMTSNGSYFGLLGGAGSEFPGDAATEAGPMILAAFKGGRGYQAGAISYSKTMTDLAKIGVNTTHPSLTPGIISVQQSQYYTREGGQTAIDQVTKEAIKIVGATSSTGTTTGTTKGKSTTKGSKGASTSPKAGAATASQDFTTNIAGGSPGGKKGKPTSGAVGSQMTRFNAIVTAANAISAKNYPYTKGGHARVGVPDATQSPNGQVGFDCSGAVSAVLFAAGLTTVSFATGSEDPIISAFASRGLDNSTSGVNIFVKNTGSDQDHTFMQIGGKFWGTSGFARPGGGAGWFTQSPGASYLGGFEKWHINQNVLGQLTKYTYMPGSSNIPGGATGSAGGGSGTTTGGASSTDADAFSTFINLPSIFTQAEAIMFTGKRSFMADQPLFPFVEQLCQASMRNFMSMPNGNFFAFFPDYFGLFGRKYYWEIRDIEIMDGRIDLSDDPLVTHVGVAGDVTQFNDSINVFDLLETAGIFTILDAFTTGYVSTVGETPTIVNPSGNDKKKSSQGNKQAAISFLQTYGARPYVQEVPMIRSAFFEMFLAFQNFMVLWSKQFETTFELTFMPELFPGGLVGLPDHHIQLYVEEVAHNFDYTNGFTTTVNFSSPSMLPDDSLARPNVTAGLVRRSLLVGQNSPRGVGVTPTKTGSEGKSSH